MVKRFAWVLCVLFTVVLAVSCTTSTSVGGASITTGDEMNEETFTIVSEKTTFEAGSQFYYVFQNNTPFGTNVLTLQLIDSESKEVLFEHDYDVETNYNMIYDIIWFNEPGKYKIACILDGKVRAAQEVIIE